MTPAYLAWSATAALASLALHLVGGPAEFHPGACAAVRAHVPATIVGQPLATRAMADAVCDHLADEAPTKPLVLSAHGPPGVGKSASHAALAAALYRADPGGSTGPPCPGRGCPGYRVVFGLDYTPDEKPAALAAVKASILDHVASHPQSLLVIEEYDKLDCGARALLRSLLGAGAGDAARAALARSVVVLESNAGYAQLHAMVEEAGDRERVEPEAAARVLKDLVFGAWTDTPCGETPADASRSLAAVDHFLPFLPLEREHLAELVRRRLAVRAARSAAADGVAARFDSSVVDFLVDRADFDGRFPVEGGAEAGKLVTRYASRALADAAAALAAGGVAGTHATTVAGALAVGVDGRELVFVPDPPRAAPELAR
jgi:ATP-dependent Clp protease ATP-binding subunit ClpA